MNSKVFIYSLVTIVLGLIMAIKPDFLLNASVVIAAILAVYNGVYYFIKKLDTIPGDSVYKWTIIARSIVSVVMGFLGFFLPFQGKITWSKALLVLSIFYIVYTVLQLFIIILLSHSGIDDIPMKPYWAEVLVCAIIAILFMILSNNYNDVKSFLNIAGIIIATAGATTIVAGIFANSKNKEKGHVVEVQDEISGEFKKSDE